MIDVPLIGKLGNTRPPRSVPAFDCRTLVGEEMSAETVDGRALYGAEKAAYSIGMELSADFTRMVSTSGRDYRNASDAERALKDLRRTVAQAWRDYRKASRAEKKKGKRNGGQAHHKPSFIYLANYGHGLYGSRHLYAVRPL